MLKTELQTIEIESALQPRAAVIWLHGLGADGNDFVPIVDELDLGGLPPIRFVFPHAPVRPVTINGGMAMRAWYDIFNLDFSRRREDEAGIRASSQALEGLMARENARGVADGKIVLAGFSQGGAIALHTGLRHAGRLAGIMALSTYLPLAATLADEAAMLNQDVPIFMAHGAQDTMIPLPFAAASRDFLRAGGYAVDWREYFMGHSVCPEQIRDISGWLQQVLAE